MLELFQIAEFTAQDSPDKHNKRDLPIPDSVSIYIQ